MRKYIGKSGGITITIIGLILALIPTWLFLLTKYFTSPQGFWQNLVLFGLGLWFLAGIQIFFLVCFVFLVVALWFAILGGL